MGACSKIPLVAFVLLLTSQPLVVSAGPSYIQSIELPPDGGPSITSPTVFTDNRPFNDPFGIFGYNLSLQGQLSDSGGVPNNISFFRARNLTTGETRDLFFAPNEQTVFPGLYTRFVPFNPSQKGVWQFSAGNKQSEVTFQNSHNLDKPVQLQLPQNIRLDISSANTIPVTFNAVPGANFYALEIYKRTTSELVGLSVLNSTVPSFSVSKTLLTPGQQYLFRIRAIDRDFTELGGPAENRSVGGVEVVIPRVPVPTATPPLAIFPAPNRLFSDVVPFVNSNLLLFSPDTQTALTTPLAILDSTFFADLKVAAGGAASAIEAASLSWGIISAALQPNLLSAIQSVGVMGITLLPDEQVPPAVKLYIGALDIARQARCCPLAVPNRVFFLMDVNALIWGQGVAPQLRILANDPPDPNYRSVVVVGVPSPGGLPTTGNANLDSAFAALFDSTNRVLASLEAVNISVDRYGSALAAGDAVSATLQLEAILQYLVAYREAAKSAASDLTRLRVALEMLGVANAEFNPAEFMEIQEFLRTNGFPDGVVADLLTLGLEPDQIEPLRRALLAFDPSGRTTTLFGSINTVASALEVEKVPLPSTGLLVAVGALVAGLVGWARQQRDKPGSRKGANS